MTWQVVAKEIQADRWFVELGVVGLKLESFPGVHPPATHTQLCSRESLHTSSGSRKLFTRDLRKNQDDIWNYVLTMIINAYPFVL